MQRGRARFVIVSRPFLRPPRPRCPTPHRPRLRRLVFIVLLAFVVLAVAIVALGSQLRPRRPMQRESTLKSRSNQIATCFTAHRLRFLFWHKTSQEVVHDSFPSTEIVAADGATFLQTRAGSRPRLALVRGWQSEGWAAKEMWKLHRADRRGRDIQPVCFSAFKKLLNGVVLPSMGCICGMAALKGASDPLSIRDTEPPG